MKPVWKCYSIFQEEVLNIYVYKIGYTKSGFIYMISTNKMKVHILFCYQIHFTYQYALNKIHVCAYSLTLFL